ncbi:MAG: pyruvate dehydrogenase [Candidatus Methanomethylicota archaeon]|nr:MAG: pyruvate dehydrogenase [Candidatus Verstraetearchaeota archaeon]
MSKPEEKWLDIEIEEEEWTEDEEWEEAEEEAEE